MKYSDSNTYYDETDIEYIFSDFYKLIKKTIKNMFHKLINIDYYFYTIKIFQNLPEAVIIMFLGFFAVFNLLKYSESSYGNKFYPIITSSMYPAIIPGSLVYATKENIYKKGDIVSYVEKTPEGIETGKILTHRIIDEVDGSSFIAKGDSNSDADPVIINASQIQAKVSLTIPFLGYLEILIKKLPGFLFIIALPSLLLIKRQLNYIKNTSK